jgi:hypothetical protein
MRLPYPFTTLGLVQFLAGLVILIYPQDAISSAVVTYFGGVATPQFIGGFTAFCGAIILYSRWRRYALTSWKRTLLAAPLLLYCVTVLLIARNPLIILIVLQLMYFVLHETRFSYD